MPRFESLSEEMTRRIESDRQHGTSPKVFYKRHPPRSLAA